MYFYVEYKNDKKKKVKSMECVLESTELIAQSKPIRWTEKWRGKFKLSTIPDNKYILDETNSFVIIQNIHIKWKLLSYTKNIYLWMDHIKSAMDEIQRHFAVFERVACQVGSSLASGG